MAYCADVGVFTCGLGSGAGDGGRAGVHHVGDVGRRHEGGGRAFVVESRRVSPCSGVELVSGVCNLAEEFQSGRVGGTKGSECGCNKLISSSFYVGGVFIDFHALR